MARKGDFVEDKSTQRSNNSELPQAHRKRLLPPAWAWAVLGVLAVVAAGLQTTDLLKDHAQANVGCWLSAFVAATTLLVWFWLLSDYSRKVRGASFVGFVVLVVGLVALFRIEGVSGELVPEFAFRFSPKPDELLEGLPARLAKETASRVDLRTTTEEDFPQFLGPDRSVSATPVSLAPDWTARPPKQIWRQRIGAGWSAFAVVNGHAVTMEQRGEAEMVTCYNLKTGQPEWAHSTATRYEGLSGGVGPRSTPTVDEGTVYALGATGYLLCLDGATGKCRWRKNLLEEYGLTAEEESAILPWGRSNSPLVVEDLVIVPAGGPRDGRRVSLVAYEKRTGDCVWEGGNRQISYSSPALATLAGTPQILIVNEDSASGHDPATGRALWEHPWPGTSNAQPNVSQAMPVPPDRVLLSKGYGQGAALLQLVPQDDGTFLTEIVWKNSKILRTKFTNVAIDEGAVYGLSDGILECADLENGCRIWKEGRYRHGQILRAGDLLLVLAESGEVVLVEATPQRANNVLGRFLAIEGMSWNNPALYGRYLLVRNAEQAACYELPSPPDSPTPSSLAHPASLWLAGHGRHLIRCANTSIGTSFGFQENQEK